MLGAGPVLDESLRGALRQGLHQLGCIEGQNLAVVERSVASLEELPSAAAELVASRVRLIVSTGPAPTAAAMGASATVPIVMTDGGNPIAAGFVRSLAHPGGNVTGLTSVTQIDQTSKRVELLKEAVPSAGRLAHLTNLSIPANPERAEAARAAARRLGMEFLVGGRTRRGGHHTSALAN